MAVEIGALRALLSLDSAAFEQGAKRAQASMNRLQRSMTQASDKLRKVGRTLSTRVTAPLTLAAGAAVRSSLKTVDAQAKMAESLDTSVVSLQNLTRASKLAGISQSDLEGSLRRMTRRVSLAEQGTGAAAKALDRLNLSAEDLSDMPVDQRVDTITSAIRDMVPAAEQAGVASQIFGDRTGIAIMRLDGDVISQAADEIDRFGVAVSDVDASKIEEANDAISGMGLAMRGIANQLTVAVAPTIERLAQRLAEAGAWFSDLAPRTKEVAVAIAGLAAVAGPAALAIGGLAAVLGAMNLPLVGLAALATAAGGALVLLSGDTSEYEKASEAAKKAQDALNVAMGTFYETAAPSSAREAINAANANYQLAESAMAAAEAEVAKKKAQIQALEGGVDTARKQGLRSIAEGDLAQAREDLAEAEAAIEDARRARDRAARSVTGAMDLGVINVNGDGAKDLQVQVEGLGDALKGIGGGAGGGGAGGGGAAKAAEDALDRMGRAAGDAAASGIDRLDQGLKSVSDAMAGAIVQGKSMGTALSRVFDQIATDLLSSGINQLLGGGINQLLGGSSGGGRRGLLGMGNFLGFLDGGGNIGAGQFAIAGERGPEIVTGPAQVTSRADTARMMQGAGGRSEVVIRLDDGLRAEILEQAGEQTVQIVSAAGQAQRRSFGGQIEQYQDRGTSG